MELFGQALALLRASKWAFRDVMVGEAGRVCGELVDGGRCLCDAGVL
jgi:hypothetical protein